jgi:hypothetical protein
MLAGSLVVIKAKRAKATVHNKSFPLSAKIAKAARPFLFDFLGFER